jgi:hypothetical protein
MKKRWLLVPLLLFLLAGLALWLDPTRILWGLLRGEAFFDGRPTSYWSRELAKLGQRAGGPWATNYNIDRDGPRWWDSVSTGLGLQLYSGPNIEVVRGNDPKAVPVLCELAKDNNPYVRWCVMRVLPDKATCTDMEIIVPVLTTALADPDFDVRMAAADNLSKLEGADVDSAIPVLIEALQHEQPWMQVKGVEALAALGPRAKPAVPALVQLWKDEDHVWSVLDLCGNTLKAIDPGAAAKAGVP